MEMTKKEPLKSVLTISTGFVIIFLITKWNWAVMVSAFIGLIGVLSAFLSKQIDYFWMKLTFYLSLIVPNILLGVVFYLFLFPISLLSKLFGRSDLLILKNRGDSIFVDSKKTFNKVDFEKPW